MSNFKNKAINKEISSGLIILLATACGIIVANLYYAQPLIGVISHVIGLSNSSAGLIVTLTQIGYVVGLLFLVPLGDIVENRKLIIILLILSAVALTATVFVKSAILLLVA
ncbi:MFS transporter, partial [Bacillus toyonensis]